MTKDISVIIPTHNRTKQLNSCLNYLLNQTIEKNKYEIIVVNDGGGNQTAEIVKKHSNNHLGLIVYIEQQKQNAAAARNKGAKVARGDILFFLDDDCLAKKDVLDNILDEFNTFKEKDICLGGFSIPGKQNFIGHTIDLLCCHLGDKYNYVYNPYFLSTSNLCVKKSFFLNQGGFKESMRCAEDTEWSYRIKSKGYKLIKSPKIIICHQHERNTLKKLIQQAYEWGVNTDFEAFKNYKDLLIKEKSIDGVFFYPLYGLLLSCPPGLSILTMCLLAPLMALGDTLHSCARLLSIKKEVIVLSPFIFIRSLSLRCGHLMYFVKRRNINVHRGRKGLAEILFYNLNKHKLKTPPYLKLFVTNNCNAKCLHCFYWKRIKEKKSEMTVDEYNSLSSQLGFLEKISLTGGEPFLRDDLASIAEIFYRNNHCKTIGINSNGICSDKIFVTIEKILKTCPKANLGLCLGIDGLGKVHDMARGTENAFRQLTETCNGLARIKKKFSRLHLSLNFTLTNKNIQEFIPLYEFSKKNFLDYWPFGFSVLLPKDFDNNAIAGRPQDASLSQPDLIDIKNLSGMIQGDFRKSGIIDLKYLMEKTYFKHTLQIMHKNKQLTKCLVGDLCSVVDELGNVYFCEFLKNIGNVKNKSFRDIWSSSEAVSQRNEIMSGKCFCYSPYFQNLNLKYQLLNPKILYNIFKGFE